MNRDQRLAVLNELIQAKGLAKTVQGILGLNHVPSKIEDFDSKVPEVCDRCDEFLKLVGDVCKQVRDEISKRPREPRQSEIDFGKAQREAEKKEAEKERRARKKVAAGDTTGRQKAVDALRGKSKAAAATKKTSRSTVSTRTSKKKVKKKS